MTDSKNSLQVKMQISRAIIAAKIAENEGLDYANPSLIEKNKVNKGQQYLTLLKSHFVGYPLGDELLPLAQILSGESLNRTEEQKEIGLTKQDLLLDDANAMLHDHLLNISPPFSLFTDEVMTMPIINRVYQKVLKEAVFAGKIDNSESLEFQQALDLLFTTDEFGIPQPNEVYKKYEEFEEKALDLMLEIRTAKKESGTEIIGLLENKLERLNVKWLTTGQKSKVEAALKKISSEDENAGFEDERIKFQDLYNDKTQGRLTSDLRYGTVQLSPLAMLFDLEDKTLWHKISLNSDDVLKIIGPRERSDFDIDLSQIHNFTEALGEFNFEYTSCNISREWLDRDFLNANYWKSKDILSDGKGGGILPTIPRKIFFIRDVSYSLKGQYEVEESFVGGGGLKILPIKKHHKIKLYKEKDAKLLKQIDKVKILNKSFKKSPNAKILQHMVAVKPMEKVAKANLNHKIFRTLNTNIPINIGRIKPNKNKKNKKAKLNVSGILNADEGVNLDGLILSFQDINSDNSLHINVSVSLNINSTDKARFSFSRAYRRTDVLRPLRLHIEKIKGVKLTLRMADGTLIKEHEILFNSNTGDTNANIKWDIQTTKQIFELASDKRPTLVGYGIELNGVIPNTDESLTWE